MFARPTLRWLVTGMCLALLMVRLSGLHVHLCFDGSEPPSSYHTVDAGVHHLDEPSAGESHSDRDLLLAKDALVKKSSAGLDLVFAWLAVGLLYLLRVPARQPRPAASPTHRQRSFSWLRPPLRGPPSFA